MDNLKLWYDQEVWPFVNGFVSKVAQTALAQVAGAEDAVRQNAVQRHLDEIAGRVRAQAGGIMKQFHVEHPDAAFFFNEAIRRLSSEWEDCSLRDFILCAFSEVADQYAQHNSMFISSARDRQQQELLVRDALFKAIVYQFRRRDLRARVASRRVRARRPGQAPSRSSGSDDDEGAAAEDDEGEEDLGATTTPLPAIPVQIKRSAAAASVVSASRSKVAKASTVSTATDAYKFEVDPIENPSPVADLDDDIADDSGSESDAAKPDDNVGNPKPGTAEKKADAAPVPATNYIETMNAQGEIRAGIAKQPILSAPAASPAPVVMDDSVSVFSRRSKASRAIAASVISKQQPLAAATVPQQTASAFPPIRSSDAMSKVSARLSQLASGTQQVSVALPSVLAAASASSAPVVSADHQSIVSRASSRHQGVQTGQPLDARSVFSRQVPSVLQARTAQAQQAPQQPPRA